MNDSTPKFGLAWGSAERAVFFSPWWRAVVTITLGLVVPVSLVPVLAAHPGTETWLGPASILPIAVWLFLRVRRTRAEAGRRGQ